MSTSGLPKSQEAFEKLCTLLDFTKANGLVTDPSEAEDDYLRQTTKEVKKKLNINAIFFFKPGKGGPPTPLIYFRLMESKDTTKIAELHKLSWNMGQAPLLFIVLPDSVLVYNNLEPPRSYDQTLLQLDDKAGLIYELRVFSRFSEEIERIRQFERAELETGNFWRRNVERFQIETSVFRTLLNHISFMRGRLKAEGLSQNLVDSILVRSIFVKYLEDRRDNQGLGVFPAAFFGQFLNGATCFVELLKDKRATYKFFRALSDKFNGDIFVIGDNEEDSVKQHHLDLLARMLRGEEHLQTRQMVLWPLYSFDVIPIEFISTIYELMLSSSESDKREAFPPGVHYTPYRLVEFLMDEVLPIADTSLKARILDPACGSGIFLVEAYRRLIASWKKANHYGNPTALDLLRILRENIFGVDKDDNAIRIAALSLYLTLCDFLEPKAIWAELKFERLMNRNLFVSDFFDRKCSLTEMKFDLIVGNPPWESKLTRHAELYVKSRGLPVGDRQICQVFLWKVADLCSPNGRACMIVSSKALLFNRSAPNSRFRRRFFSKYAITEIFNFSALRHSLFSRAVGPSAAIIFLPTPPIETESISYCSPKPSYTLQDQLSFVIEPQDVANIALSEALESEIIWKVAMWGSPRDYELVRKLSAYPTLEHISKKRGWIHGEGYTEGGRKKYPTRALQGKLEVTPDRLVRFVVKKESLRKCEKNRFWRWSITRKEIYQAPHLLIRQSPQAGIGFISAVMIDDSVFPQSIVGIHSNAKYLNDLISVCQVVNSDLYLYYAMLTSGRFLVERDELETKEIMNIPIPREVLDRNIDFDYLTKLARDDKFRKSEEDKLMRLYAIDSAEKELILDAIGFTLDYYRRREKSTVFDPPSDSSVRDYVRSLCEILNNQFASSGRRFGGTVYSTKAPLRVISLRLASDGEETLTEVGDEGEIKELLKELDKNLIEKKTGSIYVRRHYRTYSKNSISIIKPNQARYWTRSSAFVDADRVYGDVMRSWRPGR
jgi:type I restriction-modification system DNA methylase subunit